ncbi:WD40 repeat domain-containing protein [Lacihabitans soyangensis]|uniref:WD40 repeat domain-containing protein n=1 Tax=Lacihabitans soyangensis TaxID=869394 RepID=A0AAE3H7U4_9BACT|nr:WD40 repeat domain-containing protein [Lacihabitans soyangensis]MCP9764715.1 WD40 repeat domain-containing protein [Lacihabitans soyangensis]
MDFNIEKVETFTGHKDCVYTLCEGSSDKSFYSAGADGLVVEWAKADLGRPIAKVSNSVYAMLNLPNENKLWIANNTEGLHLIDTKKKEEVLNVPLGKVSIFDIKQHGNLLIVSDHIGFLHILDTDSNRFVRHFEGAQKSARCLAVSTKRNEMAVGFSDWKIRVYDLEKFELKHVIEGHQNSVFSLQYFGDNDLLVSGSRDAHLMVWDSEKNYQNVARIPAHNFAINHIIYIQKHELLATCSMDKSIKIWDAENLELKKVIDKSRNASHGTSVNKLLWREKEQFLLSASDDRTISMWNLF